MLERIERIRLKASTAGKRLCPCLGEEAITDFERKHGTRLPEEYRAFVMQVGNGGDGPPYYGLAGLGEVANDLLPDDKAKPVGHPLINAPFPFTRAWVWEDGDQSTEGTREDVECGVLYLGNDGCGVYWHLVVTGPDRGRVWQLCGEGIQPTEPKRDFLQWYEDWLDGVDNWWDAPEGGPTLG